MKKSKSIGESTVKLSLVEALLLLDDLALSFIMIDWKVSLVIGGPVLTIKMVFFTRGSSVEGVSVQTSASSVKVKSKFVNTVS